MNEKKLSISNRVIRLYIALTSLFLLGCIAVHAQSPADWKKMKAPITMLLANDLGRNGYYDQKNIAEKMGEVAETIGPECVVAIGDIHHFYGVASVHDPLWMTNYEQIYSHPELMIPWYAVLGNHEYRGNTQAVIEYREISRRWMMPARYYSKVWKDDGISVRIIFMDTTPLIDKYRNDQETYPDACKQDMNEQLKWLEQELASAKEDWVVVVGHHPIYAYTPKPEPERLDMQLRVDPLLKKYNVDLYVCGHIHNFQHLRMKDSPIDYVVNTSASLSRKVRPIAETIFCSPEPGFTVLSANKKQLNLYLLDKEGKVLDTIIRNK